MVETPDLPTPGGGNEKIRPATTEEWRTAYEAKIQDFARETLRSSILSAVALRLYDTLMAEVSDRWSSSERAHYFSRGFPAEEKAALVAALRSRNGTSADADYIETVVPKW